MMINGDVHRGKPSKGNTRKRGCRKAASSLNLSAGTSLLLTFIVLISAVLFPDYKMYNFVAYFSLIYSLCMFM